MVWRMDQAAITRMTKIYVQLQPDQTAVAAVRKVQQDLAAGDTGQSRLVARNALHVTVIHFGLVAKFIESVRPHTTTPDDAILLQVHDLAKSFEAAIESTGPAGFTLKPLDLAYFGAHHTSLVIEFQPVRELQQLHTTCLALLKDMLHRIGLQQVDSFMAEDTNLRYTLSLKPHLTIAHSYHGSANMVSLAAIADMTFSIMPVIYPDKL